MQNVSRARPLLIHWSKSDNFLHSFSIKIISNLTVPGQYFCSKFSSYGRMQTQGNSYFSRCIFCTMILYVQRLWLMWRQIASSKIWVTQAISHQAYYHSKSRDSEVWTRKKAQNSPVPKNLQPLPTCTTWKTHTMKIVNSPVLFSLEITSIYMGVEIKIFCSVFI